jgi:hypothetical protein
VGIHRLKTWLLAKKCAIGISSFSTVLYLRGIFEVLAWGIPKIQVVLH